MDTKEFNNSEEVSKEETNSSEKKVETVKKPEAMKLDKDSLTMLILVVLVAVSGFQTYKLSALQGGSVKASAPVQNSSGGSLPAALDSLPSQVGGC